MTWHSSARHTPDVAYAKVVGTAMGQTYDIISPVKTGKKIYFGTADMIFGLAEESPAFLVGLGLDYESLPLIQCLNCDSNGTTIEAGLLLHVVTADGKEYLIGEDSFDESGVYFVYKGGCIVLEEGDSLRLTVTAIEGAPEVEVVVPFAEVNGPIITRRVILDTEEWQDAIPSPRPGKVNIFLGNDVSRPGIAQLSEDGTDESAEMIIRRQENGVTVRELPPGDGQPFVDGILNLPPEIVVILGGISEAAFVSGAIRAGQTLQVKIGDFDPGAEVGKLCAVSYIEVDDNTL